MSKKFKRVSKEDVRDNARKGGGGWPTELKLPDGVRLWTPTQGGTVQLDILPYVITTNSHPDRIAAGKLWYKFPFKVHNNIGVNDESVVCPTSVGKPCPVCEERRRLSDAKADKEVLEALYTKEIVAFNVIDPDDKNKIAVYADSQGKFYNVGGKHGLKRELKDGGDDLVCFYDINEDGRTLNVRYSEESFNGNKFLAASRIDFVKRQPIDESILDRVVTLEDMFVNITPYDRLKAMFLQLDDAGQPLGKPNGADTSKSRSASPSGAASGPSTWKVSKTASAGSSNGGSAAAAFKVGDRATFTKPNGKVVEGTIIDIDDDEVLIKDAKDKEHEVGLADIKPVAPPAPAAPAAKEGYSKGDWIKTDDGVVGEIIEIDGDEYTIKDAAGKEHEIDEDDIDGKAEAPAKPGAKAAATKPGEKAKPEVGDTVTDNDGTTGELVKIDEDKEEATIKDAKTKQKVVVDLDDIEVVDGAGGGAAAAPELKEGMKISWDDDDEKGEIVKLDIGGKGVKVKKEDGTREWIDPAKEEIKAL